MKMNLYGLHTLMEDTLMTLSLKTERTLVTLLLDRSGSMHGVRHSTIAACNDMIGQLRQSSADIRMSLVQFDCQVHGEACLVPSFVGRKVGDVAFLELDDYQPRGGTPLYDAIGMTVEAIEDSIKGRDNVKVVVLIQTDGQECNSTRFSLQQVRALIERKTGEGWEFNFMGAGLNAQSYTQSAGLGLKSAATVAYDHTDLAATRSAYDMTAQNIRAFAEGTAASTSYSSAQKIASGDREDPDLAPAKASGNGNIPVSGMFDPSKLQLGLRSGQVPPRPVATPGQASPVFGVRKPAFGSPAFSPVLTKDAPATAQKEPFSLNAYGEE